MSVYVYIHELVCVRASICEGEDLLSLTMSK